MSTKRRTSPELKYVVRNIRERGMTVSGWARLHGYSSTSVFQVLYGLFGDRGPVGKAIRRDLKKEGLLKKLPEGNDADNPARRRTA
jgi:transposase-like protein